MLRIFFFSIIRFLFAALVIYVVLSAVRAIVRALRGPAHDSSPRASGHPRPENPPKSKEEYKDVKDAKFEELPDKKREGKGGERS
jgi:hypothetical protein